MVIHIWPHGSALTHRQREIGWEQHCEVLQWGSASGAADEGLKWLSAAINSCSVWHPAGPAGRQGGGATDFLLEHRGPKQPRQQHLVKRLITELACSVMDRSTNTLLLHLSKFFLYLYLLLLVVFLLANFTFIWRNVCTFYFLRCMKDTNSLQRHSLIRVVAGTGPFWTMLLCS